MTSNITAVFRPGLQWARGAYTGVWHICDSPSLTASYRQQAVCGTRITVDAIGRAPIEGMECRRCQRQTEARP